MKTQYTISTEKSPTYTTYESLPEALSAGFEACLLDGSDFFRVTITKTSHYRVSTATDEG